MPLSPLRDSSGYPDGRISVLSTGRSPWRSRVRSSYLLLIGSFSDLLSFLDPSYLSCFVVTPTPLSTPTHPSTRPQFSLNTVKRSLKESKSWLSECRTGRGIRVRLTLSTNWFHRSLFQFFLSVTDVIPPKTHSSLSTNQNTIPTTPRWLPKVSVTYQSLPVLSTLKDLPCPSEYYSYLLSLVHSRNLPNLVTDDILSSDWTPSLNPTFPVHTSLN